MNCHSLYSNYDYFGWIKRLFSMWTKSAFFYFIYKKKKYNHDKFAWSLFLFNVSSKDKTQNLRPDLKMIFSFCTTSRLCRLFIHVISLCCLRLAAAVRRPSEKFNRPVWQERRWRHKSWTRQPHPNIKPQGNECTRCITYRTVLADFAPKCHFKHVNNVELLLTNIWTTSSYK